MSGGVSGVEMGGAVAAVAPSGFCTNEPGYGAETDNPMSAETYTDWGAFNEDSEPQAWAEIGSDATAPRSPNNVWAGRITNGWRTGFAPGSWGYTAYGGTDGLSAFYVCTAVKFSPNWIEAPNNINKLMFATFSGGDPLVIIADSGEPAPDSSWFLQITTQGITNGNSVFGQNVTDTVYHNWGDWVELEVQVTRGDQDGQTGIVKAWIDGVLAINYTDTITMDSSTVGFRNIRIEPTYHTGGSTVSLGSDTMSVLFDFVKITGTAN